MHALFQYFKNIMQLCWVVTYMLIFLYNMRLTLLKFNSKLFELNHYLLQINFVPKMNYSYKPSEMPRHCDTFHVYSFRHHLVKELDVLLLRVSSVHRLCDAVARLTNPAARDWAKTVAFQSKLTFTTNLVASAASCRCDGCAFTNGSEQLSLLRRFHMQNSHATYSAGLRSFKCGSDHVTFGGGSRCSLIRNMLSLHSS